MMLTTGPKGISMFDHILVPLEGKPHEAEVTKIADILAGLWDADVEIVSVLAQGDDTADREAQIAKLVSSLEHRPQLTVRYLTYSVADSIADEFEDEPNTLLVMGTAAGSRRGAVIDSVAEDVLAATASPVLLVGPHVSVADDWPAGELFVCTDGSHESEVIVADAAAWADALELRPWVLTAADPAELPTSGDFIETGHVQRVARKISSITGEEAEFDIIHDENPIDGILRYASDRQPALIVVATEGRKGWSRLVHGSVSMGIVHDAAAPVLARIES
jgi:nucleotide-binding universal stress UspA family protein